MPKTIIAIIIIIIVIAFGYWIYQSISLPQGMTEAEAKNCEADSDCIVFGKDGDCNCGCFNKNYSDWQAGGACFCAAPVSCKCTDGKCEGVTVEDRREEACLKSGGQLTTSLCCKSTEDYPNLCLVGPCGCSPENSHQVKICDCGPGRCFNGEECVLIETIDDSKKSDLIKVENPSPNQVIESPLFIKGEARGFWFFEADFPLKLFDDNGFLLGIRPARALEDWMTEDFVAFELTLPFAAPSSRKGSLILEKDNPSGLAEQADELVIPVYFKEATGIGQELMAAKIFLSDSRFAGEPYFDCSRTIAVERQVPKSQAVARAAIEALLRGATEQEIKQGFVSNINSGVRVQSLTIENGTARVDFDEQLEFQVGGSCRVAAIRAQIRETLKQFPTVDEVIISINSRTEDILQP